MLAKSSAFMKFKVPTTFVALSVEAIEKPPKIHIFYIF